MSQNKVTVTLDGSLVYYALECISRNETAAHCFQRMLEEEGFQNFFQCEFVNGEIVVMPTIRTISALRAASLDLHRE